LGLLLLRVTLAVAALVQGGFYLFRQENQAVWMRAFGLSAIACGASLLVGFLTPVAGSLVCLGGAFFVILMSPATYAVWSNAIYTIAVSAAIVMLGPGAFSLDARMFGRREIIIPDKAGTLQN
jgi:uncharacterized membrane protein YphA (DoxX/SURF4 family)